MRFDLKIPPTLREVKLSQWQKFASILEKNKGKEDSDFIKLKQLEIFCDVSLKSIHNLPLNTFDAVLEHLNVIFSQKTQRVNTFKLKGTDDEIVEFGMIPKLDDMTYGEYEDLEKYIFDEKQLHRAMAVLYRPISYKKGDRYAIHPYKGTEYLAEVMKDTPLDVVLGAKVFFWSLAKKLGVYMMDSTLNQLLTSKENISEKDLEENGVATKQSILSQKEMLQNLMKLPDFHSTNV